MEKKKNNLKVFEIGLFVLTVAVSGGFAYLKEYDVQNIIRIVILTAIPAGGMVFSMECSRQEKTFLFDNEDNFWRFTVLYVVALIGSIFFSLLPQSGWPFLVIFISLMLFSNRIIALTGAGTLLLLCVLFTGQPAPEIYAVYFITGLVGILIFSDLDEEFKVKLPIFIALSVQTVVLCVREVLMANEPLRPELFYVPLVNDLVCFFLLIMILKLFSFSTIYKTRDIYMDINDPEGPLLVELKEKSKEEYFRAIHTAYLCDRIAKKLELDDAAAKAIGYYQRIGILRGENSYENVKAILEEHNFPEKVQQLLKEYLSRNENMVSKETAILLMADTVISSLNYLFSKDKAMQPDYDKIIETIYQKKLESGVLLHSRISVCELETMKTILKEEKLYYDFLR